MKPAELRKPLITIGAALAVTLAINYGLSSYWVFLFTGAVITAIALQGVEIGRAHV